MFNNQPNFSKKEITMSGITQRVANEAQGLDALIHKMSDEDFELYHHFGRDKPSGHRQPYAAYIDRVFYIYQAQGRDRMNIQRPPKIDAIVRVIDLQLTRHRGLEIELMNETTNEIQIVGLVPARAFGFPVFVQAPNSTALRSNLISRPHQQDSWENSVGLFIKTGNDPKFFSKGGTYMLPSKNMTRLYSGVEWRPESFEHDLDKPKGMH